MYQILMVSLILILTSLPSFIFGAENSLPQKSPLSKPLQVLFIGNSYTYYNDMPGTLSKMSKLISEEKTIDVGWYAIGSASLKTLWEEGGAEKRINEKKWDYVVLQEKNSFLFEFPELSSDFVKMFKLLIDESGAKTLLFLTWAPQDIPWMYKENYEKYQRLSKDLDIPLVPVGVAWQLAVDASPNIQLYLGGGNHPNEAGSYATACVFYTVMLQETDLCPIISTFNIPNTDIEIIRNAASEAVHQQQSTSGIK